MLEKVSFNYPKTIEDSLNSKRNKLLLPEKFPGAKWMHQPEWICRIYCPCEGTRQSFADLWYNQTVSMYP